MLVWMRARLGHQGVRAWNKLLLCTSLLLCKDLAVVCPRRCWHTDLAGNAGLTKMKRLNLGWCARLDDAELAHVTRLSALTSLELARTKVCSMLHEPYAYAGAAW